MKRTLLVVPALYALWFGVRRDEPMEPVIARVDREAQSGEGAMPFPIAAE